MKKVIFKLTIIILGLIITLNSCINADSKTVAEAKKLEVLPEDIVELRDDQIKLAGIQTGSVEMRSVGNTLKVNGIVSVAPQNQATVSVPLGGFINSSAG
jgi:cobalt-zinc-cadmium efflux system membrane fusion protein